MEEPGTRAQIKIDGRETELTATYGKSSLWHKVIEAGVPALTNHPTVVPLLALLGLAWITGTQAISVSQLSIFVAAIVLIGLAPNAFEKIGKRNVQHKGADQPSRIRSDEGQNRSNSDPP